MRSRCNASWRTSASANSFSDGATASKRLFPKRSLERTQQWEVYNRPELIWPRPKVTVDRDELLHHISLNHQFYNSIHQTLVHSRQPYLDVDYETLFNAEEQGRLLRFLGIADVGYSLTAASIKQNSTNLEDSIANFAELAASLEGSDLGTELHDRDM